jgi:hypothetical protein
LANFPVCATSSTSPRQVLPLLQWAVYRQV